MAIDPELMVHYRRTAESRHRERRAQAAASRTRAVADARKGAALLRATFGATRVMVFGSVVDEDGRWFGVRSDVDLAAWGVRPDDYFLAVAKLQEVSREFSFDLVAMETCPRHLEAAVAAGIDL